MTFATSKIRILGEPKPQQTGEFSSKVVKAPTAKPKPRPVKKPS